MRWKNYYSITFTAEQFSFNMQSLKEAILAAKENKVAIGHFNISEFAALRAIVSASKKLGVPAYIGTSSGEAGFIGMKQAVALIRSIREETGHRIYLNADHMRDLAKVEEAAKAGYDSIIFDGAQFPFEENIKKTKEAVEVAKSINPDVLVEGEVGYIGVSSKLLDELPKGVAIREEDMTSSEEAKQFVEETGVDLLAPAVGEIHGMMKSAKNPNLNIERILSIKNAVSVPLVLHGGSGVSDEDFKASIRAGISAVHINTEIRIAWRKGLEMALASDKDMIAPYKLLSSSEKEVYKIVLKRLELFNLL